MESPEKPPVFPYEILWEEFGNQRVTTQQLSANGDDYDLWFDIAEKLNFSTPRVRKSTLAELVAKLGADATASLELVQQSYLIAGWYLSPVWRSKLATDFQSTRKRLRDVSAAARQLHSALGGIEPQVVAALDFVRAVEPGRLSDDHPDIFGMTEACHDLALAAERVLNDTAAKGPGRRSEFMRDQALRMLIEALGEAGCDRPAISDGTNEQPSPHFANESGRFIFAWFQQLDPKITEAKLAPIAKRVRVSVPKSSGSGRGKQ